MSDTKQSADTVTYIPTSDVDPEPFTDRYDILQELGRGGMGIVYHGRHRKLEKPVAIKFIKSLLDAPRFLREARLLAKIDSPHVVRVHDFDVSPHGVPMLVMELIEGFDLRQHIELQSGPLDESKTLEWMRQVAKGLLAAAEQGIIHRDVKPSNIRIDHYQQARIMDFGLSRSFADSAGLTISDTWMGTPLYMSPEQAESPRTVDTRADIYSFGATFYHALTGRPPFEGETPFVLMFKHKTEPLIAPHSLNPALTRTTCEILERCLAKAPDHRFSSFTELLSCLSPTRAPSSPWDSTDEAELQPYLEKFQHNRRKYLHRDLAWRAPDEYLFAEGRKLQILMGDIAAQEADAIVSSDNWYLTMDDGCSLAILKRAGEIVHTIARQFVPVLPGRVVVTPAGNLQARFIFHAVTNGWAGRTFRASRDIVSELVSAIVYHADTLSVKSIAIPLLGTGGARLSPEVALDAIFLALSRHLHRGITSIHEARLVLYPKL